MDGGAMDGPPRKESHAYKIYIPVYFFLAFSPLMVIIRALSHKRARGRFGVDDIAITASLFAALASGVIMLLGCQFGYGQHWTDLTPFQQTQSLLYFYVCQTTYKLSLNSSKCAILLLYRRFFEDNWRFRHLCNWLLACVACWVVAVVTATIFQCTPVARAYDRSVPGTCISNSPFWYANATFNILTDLIILGMPMPLVYKLKIPTSRKVGLALIFCVGIFTTMTSALRITSIDIQAKTTDKTYDVDSTMWTIIEMNMAIFCACSPQSRPLIAGLFSKLVQFYRRIFSHNSSPEARDYERGGVQLKTPSVTDSIGATNAQQSSTPSEAEDVGQELYTLRVIRTYHQ